MPNAEFLAFLADHQSGPGTTSALARAVARGEVWRADLRSGFHDETTMAALRSAMAEWSRSRAGASKSQSPKSKANLLKAPLAKGAATPRRRHRCPGCGSAATDGTVRVRNGRTGEVRTWHVDCRDRQRFGPDAVRDAGRRPVRGMRSTRR